GPPSPGAGDVEAMRRPPTWQTEPVGERSYHRQPPLTNSLTAKPPPLGGRGGRAKCQRGTTDIGRSAASIPPAALGTASDAGPRLRHLCGYPPPSSSNPCSAGTAPRGAGGRWWRNAASMFGAQGERAKRAGGGG